MKRHSSITMIGRALLFSAVVLFAAGNGTSYAQQSDIEQVKAAIATFHAALESLDITKLEPLWVHDASVMVIQPRDKSIAVGWDAVKKDFGWFSRLSEFKLTPMAGPYIQVKGDVAWASQVETALIKPKTGAMLNTPTFENFVFEKQGGAWLLVSHTALRVPK